MVSNQKTISYYFFNKKQTNILARAHSSDQATQNCDWKQENFTNESTEKHKLVNGRKRLVLEIFDYVKKIIYNTKNTFVYSYSIV